MHNLQSDRKTTLTLGITYYIENWLLGSEPIMALLLLNRRDILNRLPHWFPDSRKSLVVVTSRDVLHENHATELLRVETLDTYDTIHICDAIRRIQDIFVVERILSTAESDILRAAKLRSELNLPGQGIKSAIAFRDKYRMKSIAQKAGVAVAPMIVVADASRVADFAKHVGYPIVIKRCDGAASIGMHVVHDGNQLNKLLRTNVVDSSCLAEGFVKGDMYHVDGFMVDGKVIHAWPSRYLHSQWETMYRSRPNISGMLGAAHPLFTALRDCTSQVVSALPPVPSACAFHCEFFNPDGNKVVLCEIACRPGGAGIVEAYEQTFGVNLYGVTLLGQSGRWINQWKANQAPLTRYGWAYFPPIRGRLLKLPRRCPLPYVVNFRAVAAPGSVFDGARFVTDHVAAMLFTIQQMDPVEQLREIDDWWNASVRWELQS